MAPKPKPAKGQKEKKAMKIEDKTFGLKNKNKSKKVQKFVEQVKKNAGVEQPKVFPKKKKEELEIDANLYQQVKVTQKVPFGTDPKTILCINFKNKNCTLGSKCKFSHDIQVERKTEKRSLYATEEEETMENWDQNRLESEISKKEGQQTNKTDIICKHFLQAIEDHKYGWFWICPGESDVGGCKYRHNLPPGYVLKPKKVPGEKKETITIEELIESKRKELGAGVMVNEETFAEWKKNRTAKKKEEEMQLQKKKEKEKRLKIFSGLNGREMFEFNPDWANDDDEEGMDLEVSVSAMSLDSQ